jgi:hypothetical protein
MPQVPPTPYEAGFSAGEQGLPYAVPQHYSKYAAAEYTKGHNQGYDRRQKIAYERNQRSPRSSPVPYIDNTWIPK